MEHSQNNVLHFTLGHFGTDWAQGGIPALLPYFIAACHLSYQEAAGIIFANIVLASVTQPLIGYYSDRASLPYLVPPWCLSLWVQSFSHGLYPELLVHPLFSHAERIGQQPFPSRSSSSCKRHFRRPKRQGDGDFFCRGQCRLCRRSRGSRVQRLSVWHQGAHHLRRSQFSYGSLSDEETSCNQKKTQRDRKKGMPFKRTSAEK